MSRLFTELESANKTTIDIHTAGSDFLFEFEKFLEKTGNKGQNYISGVFRRMRTFFYWLRQNDYTINNPFIKYKITPELYGTPYYITIDERNKIYNHDFSSIPRLEKQRDIFIFHCCIRSNALKIH